MPADSYQQIEALYTDFDKELKTRKRFDVYSQQASQMPDREAFKAKSTRALVLSDLGFRNQDITSGRALEAFAHSQQMQPGWKPEDVDKKLQEFVKEKAQAERDQADVFKSLLDEEFNEGAPMHVYMDPVFRGYEQKARAAINDLSPSAKLFLSNLTAVATDTSFGFGSSGGGVAGDAEGPTSLDKLLEGFNGMDLAEQRRVAQLAPMLIGPALDRLPEGQTGFFPGIEKGVQGLFEGFTDFVNEQGQNLRRAGAGKETDIAQFEAERQLLSFLRQTADQVRNKRDEREGYDWAKLREFLGSSATEMAAAVYALPVLMSSKAGENSLNDVFNNPNATPLSRTMRSVTSGAVQGALSRAQFNLLKVKGSAISGLVGQGAKREAAVRFGAKFTGTMVGETVIEGIQEFTPEMIDGIARGLGDENVNKPQFAEKWKAIQKDLPEIAGAFAVMSAIGAGAEVTVEMKQSRDMAWQTSSPEILQMMGVKADEAARIAAMENAGDRLEAFAEVTRKAKGKETDTYDPAPVITPEISEGVRRAVMEQQNTMAADSTQPVFVPLPDGTIDVVMGEGRAVNVDSPEAAFAAAQNMVTKRAEETQAALEELTGEQGHAVFDALTRAERARFEEAFPGVKIDEAEAKSLRAEVAAGRVQKKVAERRIRDLAYQEAARLSQEGTPVEPEILAQQMVEAFTDGTRDFVIGGSAASDARIENGILRAAITVNPNKDFRVLWEEGAEAHMHAMLNGGHITLFQLETMLTRVEDQIGKKFLSGTSREQLIEGFSFVARAYAAGDLKRTNFSGRMKQLLDTLAEVLLNIVGLARDIDALRERGELDPRLEANIRAGLGADNGALYASLVQKGQKQQGAATTPKPDTMELSVEKGVLEAMRRDDISRLEQKFWGQQWPKIMAKFGKAFSSKSKRSIIAAAKRAMEDLQGFIAEHPEFLGYYSEDWKLVRAHLETNYQGMADDDFWMFRLLTGLTSAQTGLRENIREGLQIFDAIYKGANPDDVVGWVTGPKGGISQDTSKIVTLSGSGPGNKARAVLNIFQIKQETGWSWEEVVNFLGEPVTPKEILSLRKHLGYKDKAMSVPEMIALIEGSGGKVTYKEGTPVYKTGKRKGQPKDEGALFPRGFLWGEKIGPYTLNSVGYTQYNTVDIWEARFIRSYFGMWENTGIPATINETQVMQSFANEFRKLWEKQYGPTDTADLQALRWFYMIDAAQRAGFGKGEEKGTISTYTEEHLATIGSEGYKGLVNGVGDGSAIPATIEERIDAGTFHIEEGPKSVPAAVEAANSYVARYGEQFGIEDPGEIKGITTNPEQSRKFGEAYEKLPTVDPEAEASYTQLVEEIEAQYRWLTEQHGMTFDHSEEDGYADSDEMRADVRDNRRMIVYKGGEDHPFLGSKTMDENGLTANDKFRAVHDYFGHAAPGTSFGPVGEERAWYAHSRMFSPLARKAMTAETRGQNSWVNYGPHMWNDAGWRGDKSNPDYIAPQDRPFAEQKSALFPDEIGITEFDTIHVRRGSDVVPATFDLSAAPKQKPNYEATKIVPPPTPVHHPRKQVDGLAEDEIVHFTGSYTGPIGYIKVQKAGTKGAERKVYRDYPEIYTNRAYIARNGYIVEEQYGIVAKNGYKVKVHPSNWYPADDPLNLREKARAKREALGYAPMDSTALNELYLAEIRDAGYLGFVNDTVGVIVRDLPLDGLGPRTLNIDFVDGFIEQANAQASFAGRVSLGGFDTSFHVTTKIKHLLINWSNQIIRRRVASLEARGDERSLGMAENLRKQIDEQNGQLEFFKGEIADYLAHFPKKKAVDLRTGEEVDPYILPRKFFPGGRADDFEATIKNIAALIESISGSRQDVVNLVELAEMNGVEVDPKFMDAMNQWAYSKTTEQLKADWDAFVAGITNPEFNDVTELGGGNIISKPIDPDTFEMEHADAYHSRFTDLGQQYWRTYGGKAFIEVTVPYNGTAVNVDTIMADSHVRGTDMLQHLRARFPHHTIHVHGAVDSAVGFYEKMKARGVIDSWTQTDELRTYSLEIEGWHGGARGISVFQIPARGVTTVMFSQFDVERHAAFFSSTPALANEFAEMRDGGALQGVVIRANKVLDLTKTPLGSSRFPKDLGDALSDAWWEEVMTLESDWMIFEDHIGEELRREALRLGYDVVAFEEDGGAGKYVEDSDEFLSFAVLNPDVIDITLPDVKPHTFSLDTLALNPADQTLREAVIERLQKATTPESEEVFLRMLLNIERIEARQKERKVKERYAQKRTLKVPVEAAQAIIDGEVDGFDGTVLTPAQVEELKREVARVGDAGARRKFYTVRTVTDVDPAADLDMLQDLATYDAMLSALPPEVRAKLGGFVTLAQLPTTASRIKFLDEKLEAIDRHLDRFLGDKLREDVAKIIKDNKVKVKKGIPQGKGAHLHAALDRIEAILDMDREQVQERTNELEAALSAKDIDPDVQERLTDDLVELLTFGNTYLKGENARSARDILEARDQLATLVQTGKERWKAVNEAERARRQGLRDQLVKEATADQGLQDQDEKKRRKPKWWKDRAAQYANRLNSWEWIVNRIAAPAGERALQSKLTKWASRLVHKATHHERRRNWQKTEEMTRAMAAIFGVSTKEFGWRFRLSRELAKMQEETDETGVYKLSMKSSKKTVEITVEKARLIVEGKVRPETYDLHKTDVKLLRTLLDENDAKKGTKRQKFEIEKRVIGGEKQMRLSQGQALNLYMMWQQTGNRNAMRHWGYSEDTITQIEEFLTPQTKLIGEWLAAQYDNEWGEINPVYARRFGVNMPRIKNYTPGRWIHMGKVEEAEMLLEETIPGASVTPGFAKSRVNHRAEPREDVDALQVYTEHMRQASHFIAWADAVKDLRSVFGHKDAQAAMEQAGGRWLRQVVNERIEFFANGGNRVEQAWALDQLRKKFTVLALAYNWGVMLKQLTSLPAFMFDLPVKTFLKYEAQFFADPKGNWEKIWSKPFVQERFSTGNDRDVQLVINSLEKRGRSRLQAGLEWGMWFGRLGDIVPVVVGGYAVYQSTYDAAIRRGATPQVADAEGTLAMEMSVERAQQSGDVKDLSSFQQGGSTARMFTMFLTSPLQYYMNTYNAIANVNAPGGKQDLVKRIIVSHILLPFAFQFVSDLVRNVADDEKELLDLNPADYFRAMLLGPLNGLFVVGHGLSGAAGYATNALVDIVNGFIEEDDDKLKKVRVWGYKSPVVELIEDTTKGLGGAVESFTDLFSDPSLDDVFGTIDGIAEGFKLTPAGGAYDVGSRVLRSVGLDDELSEAIKPQDEKLADRISQAHTEIYDLDKDEKSKLSKIKKGDPGYNEARMRIREIDETRYETLAERVVNLLKPYSNEEIREALENLPDSKLPKAVRERAFPKLDYFPESE